VELVFVVVVVWWLSIVSSQWLQWESGFPGRFVSPVVCNCLVESSIRLLLYSGLPYLEGTGALNESRMGKIRHKNEYTVATS
jgi:hypothetical protein